MPGSLISHAIILVFKVIDKISGITGRDAQGLADLNFLSRNFLSVINCEQKLGRNTIKGSLAMRYK